MFLNFVDGLAEAVLFLRDDFVVVVGQENGLLQGEFFVFVEQVDRQIEGHVGSLLQEGVLFNVLDQVPLPLKEPFQGLSHDLGTAKPS